MEFENNLNQTEPTVPQSQEIQKDHQKSQNDQEFKKNQDKVQEGQVAEKASEETSDAAVENIETQKKIAEEAQETCKDELVIITEQTEDNKEPAVHSSVSSADEKIETEIKSEVTVSQEKNNSSVNEIKPKSVQSEVDNTDNKSNQEQPRSNSDEDMNPVETETPLDKSFHSAAAPLETEEQTTTNNSQADAISATVVATETVVPEITENSKESLCLDSSVKKEPESCELTNNGEQATVANAEERALDEVTNANEDSMAMDETQIKSEAVQPATTPKAKTKKTKTSTPSKSNFNDSHSNQQKRRKKDPAAPKAPLNGYLVYFNEERAEMRMKNPNMSFGELTKIIALKWKDLPTDEKQRFINEADMDKERYVKEMAEYKKSDSYKNYVKESSQAKMARNDEIMNQSMQNDQMNMPNNFSLANESNVAGFDIPIFTEEFIEHSKTRENEMRLVRKEINELEQQNSVLHKHIEIMKQSSVKVDNDIERYQNVNNQLKKKMDAFRQALINCNIQLPSTLEHPNPNNIDDYIMRLFQTMSNPTDMGFSNHVKSVLSKINFSSLFE